MINRMDALRDAGAMLDVTTTTTTTTTKRNDDDGCVSRSMPHFEKKKNRRRSVGRSVGRGRARPARARKPRAERNPLREKLWPSEPYAIRGLFLRVHGNVRNVGFWDVTTEKRWGAAPRCMQAIKSHFPTLITHLLAHPPQKSQYRGGCTHTG